VSVGAATTSIAGAIRAPALLVLAAIAAWQATPASAQVPANISEACSADYRKLCANVAPGGGRIIACMKARESEVSDACRAALRDEQNKRGAGKQG
jgi:hypothetical protein